MSKDPAFLFYTSDFLTGTTFMNNEEVGKYIRTLCLLHQHGGKLPKEKIETVVGNLSANILEKLETDKDGSLFNKRLLIETQKRNAFCESRRTNIKHRYEATSVEHMNKHMENENENENVNKDKDGNKGGVGGKGKLRFNPPTITEVETYCLERKNSVDPQKWHSWYTANGWRVGKNPMKDWRAAVRTWERKETISIAESNLTKAQRSNLAGLKRTMERINKNDKREFPEGLSDIGGGLPRITIQ